MAVYTIFKAAKMSYKYVQKCEYEGLQFIIALVPITYEYILHNKIE
jgi:hypothetical protein